MTKLLNSFFQILLFALLVAIAGLLTLSPNLSSSVLDGINLWFACVLPSLFPFFIITACFSYLKITGKLCSRLNPISTRLFRVNGSVGYAFFMSVISGYPMGAKVVSDLRENGVLSKSEAVRAVALCSTSSPMFLISSVGTFMFNSTIFGVCLFISHLLSALTVGFVFSFYKRSHLPTNSAIISPQKMDNLLYETVYSAVISALVVGGMITLFYLATEILITTRLLSPVISFLTSIIGNEQVAKGIVLGALECTRGLQSVAVNGANLYSVCACAFICGFGGLSVIMQSLIYLKKAKIKTAPFFIAKILMAVLSVVFVLLFYPIFF